MTRADEPLRVVVTARSVYPIHGHGGLERSVYDLARHLVRTGVEVTVVTRTPDRPGGARSAGPGHEGLSAAEVDLLPGVRIEFVPYRTFPFAGRRGTTVIDRSTAYPLFGMRAGGVAATLVERGDAHIVHGFGASVLGYAKRRRSLAAPLVLNPQGLEEFGATDPSRARMKRIGYLPLQRAVRACARQADAVIATDHALVGAVREHLRVPDSKIVTIPNALDLDELDGRASSAQGGRLKAAWGMAPGEIVLLSVGRLERNKGFHVLAQALGVLKNHAGRLAREPWRWVIAGEGPFHRQLEAEIQAAGIAKHVVLAGRVPDDDLHAWYEAADLFVHPTLYEGSSLVTLEAMAHRRACVVTAAGGLPDKVSNGVNGWIVPPGDAGALAAAISGALDNRVRLAELGAAGRAIVERRFSWTGAVRETIALYERLRGHP